jgi:phosphohistidine phosphatase
MILYIFRHGIAEGHAPDGNDGTRKLTVKGREKLKDAAAGMRALGLKFDAILTSPLARAAETAEIVAAAYGNVPAPQVVPALASGFAPAEAASALKAFAKQEHVMIVGHEPQLSALASLLVAGSPDAVRLELKKGGLIALELSGRADRAGMLLFMLTPRQLRRLRK